jgi:Fe-S cluster assembly protein SufD
MRWSTTGLPGARDEEWRFTPVGAIGETAWTTPESGALPSAGSLAPFRFDASWPTLVLVNGRFAPSLSSLAGLPEGVTVRPLAEAIAAGKGERLGHLADPSATPFTALSAATFGDGLYFEVAKGATLPSPVHLLHVATDAATGALLAPRALVSLGDEARATLVESYVSLTDAAYFTNTVVEATLGANAWLEHVRIQRESERAWHIGFTHVDQHRDAHYRAFALAMGGRLARHNLHARHLASNVETLLYGLYLTRGTQLADTHSAIFHDQPHCNSWEVYKGVLADKSRAVFNGKVLVSPIAQKTDAKQTNRNLLLSDQAKVDTKPQLEIFADDVKCTHGATVGKLNEQQRYYLKTRGIGGRKAEQLLIWAFAAEVIAEIQEPTVRAELERVVHERLDELTQ